MIVEVKYNNKCDSIEIGVVREVEMNAPSAPHSKTWYYLRSFWSPLSLIILGHLVVLNWLFGALGIDNISREKMWSYCVIPLLFGFAGSEKLLPITISKEAAESLTKIGAYLLIVEVLLLILVFIFPKDMFLERPSLWFPSQIAFVVGAPGAAALIYRALAMILLRSKIVSH